MKQTNSFDLGDKIKDIEINQKKYRWMIFSLLIVFNIGLMVGLIYLCISIPKWYIYTIASITWVACVAESVRIYFKSKNAYKYEIYNNCLMIKTLYSKFIVKFENIFMIKTEKSIVDKVAGGFTNSIIIHVKDNVRNRIRLPFIAEDMRLLTQTIMQKAIEARDNQN